MQTYDVLIVGGGPAGLNAALVLARCRRSVLVVDAGEPRNAPSRALHGFLTRDGMAPADFLRLGREEVEGYGVDIVNAKVTEARTLDEGSDAAFEVTVEDGRTLRSRKLLLATGIRDRLPDVDGANDFFGRGLYYCPYCDAWEHRDEPIAAFGRGRAVIGAAVALTTWSGDVTACTDGEPISDDDRAWLDANGVALREEPVTRLEGSDVLERVCFAEGPPLECRALFFNTSRTQHSPLPRLLGCESDERGEIVTESNKGTCVPGLFVAGDADGDTEFIVVAAAEGAQAAVAINHELQEEAHTERPEKPVPAAPQ
ncbi:MAG: NAD(P)/FAD-dependent oxidoreductase [Rhodothermales bacterium]